MTAPPLSLRAPAFFLERNNNEEQRPWKAQSTKQVCFGAEEEGRSREEEWQPRWNHERTSAGVEGTTWRISGGQMRMPGATRTRSAAAPEGVWAGSDAWGLYFADEDMLLFHQSGLGKCMLHI